MLETKQQKTYFGISMVVVVILLGITIFQKPNFLFKDNTDYAAKEKQAKILAEAYKKYLAGVQTDPAASKALFQAILTQDDIRREVQAELKTNQPINLPVVAEKDLNVVSAAGQKAVSDYLAASVGPLAEFNKNNTELSKSIFADANAATAVTEEYNRVFKKVVSAPVPKEALAVQKSLVAAYTSYGKLLDISKNYTSRQNQEPWADTYQQYAAMNQSIKTFNQSYNQLISKYKLADSVLIVPNDNAKGFVLVPKAEAILGIPNLSITLGDIPRIIMDAIKEGITASFSQFMASFLDKMIQKIESNYMIANFLYYSDALVSGQYANDYLNKYVATELDRQIIRQFIPQFSCNKNNAALKQVFQAKASQHLGFDPASLNPNDPQYYQKLASVGTFFASADGQQMYYQDLAQQTESAAMISVQQELSSSGLKTPRDTLAGGIKTSINSIVSAQKAGLEAILQLGISNAGSFISQFVAQITQTLFTKFVFSGVTNSPRNPTAIGVIKEQATCMSSALLAPVVPISGTQYQQPPAPPSSDDVLRQACQNSPRGCDLPPETNP